LIRCAELCSHSLDELRELTQFLSALMQNKETRESLSNQSLVKIQSILQKSQVSAFYDLSMLESTSRDANVREQQFVKDDAAPSSFQH